MSSSQQDLERAFSLIRDDKAQEALELVEPIVQNEPENVDAWWLLAYAASEPARAREALLTVLRLDPNYANAPQAQAMLEKLNAEYPPQANELARFPELQSGFPATPGSSDSYFGAESDLENPFGELGALEPAESFVETFDSAEFEAEELFVTSDADPFAELDDDPFTTLSEDEQEVLTASDSVYVEGNEDPFAFDEFDMDEPDDQVGQKKSSKPQRVKLEPEELLDDNELAAREEKAARRSGRGPRIGRALLGLLAVLALIAVAVFLLMQGDEDKVTDPGELQVVASESTDVERSKISAAQALDTRNLGTEHRAVVATSELGDTLFVEICSRPSPDLPQLVKQGMQIAVQEAPAVQGLLPAVGVSIAQCENDTQDTLYRAAAPVEDALMYLGQANTAAEESAWVTFQSTWKKS